MLDIREDAIIWICKNQMGRRNVTDEQKNYLMGKRYEAEKRIESFHGNQYVCGDGQNVQHQTRRETKDGTSGRIGKEYGVDGRTVRRNEEFAKGLDAIGKKLLLPQYTKYGIIYLNKICYVVRKDGRRETWKKNQFLFMIFMLP